MHNYVTAIGFMDVYDTPYMDKIIKDYIEKSVENNVVKYVKKEPGKSRFITAELDMPLPVSYTHLTLPTILRV